jgi:hypothetical protein
MDLKVDEENVNTVEKQRKKIRTTTVNIALSKRFSKKQRRQLNYLFLLTKPLELPTLIPQTPCFLQSFCSCGFFIWEETYSFFQEGLFPTSEAQDRPIA